MRREELEKQVHATLLKAVPQRSMKGLWGSWQRKKVEEKVLLFFILDGEITGNGPGKSK